MSSPVVGAARDGVSAGPAIVVAVAGILVVASVAATATGGFDRPLVAGVFALFIALGELVRITLPGDRVQAPLGLAGALAYAFLHHLQPGGATAEHDVLQVVAVASTGMLVGTLPHVAVSRAPALDAVARRVLVVAFAAATARPLFAEPVHDWLERSSWLTPLLLAIVAAVTLIIDGAFAALLAVDRTRAPFWATVRNEFAAMVGIGAAVGATGLLIALAAGVMGLWAIPVLSVPLLLTQFSFRRYAGIRATYLQTIRSLSRVTELGGYTETGHARRVSRLAVAVGRDLGMGEEQLRELEYAALMHDIGQLSLHDPIPGGATLMVSTEERRRIAGLGAEVIRQTGVLDRVADIVEHQADRYRGSAEPAGDEVPLASRIIKVVNAYDDLVGGSLEIARTIDALQRIRLGMDYEYDPEVVESLARVLARTLG